MDVKKITLFAVFLMIVISSLSMVSAGWFDFLGGDSTPENFYAEGNVTAEDVNITLNGISEATPDTMTVKHYYGGNLYSSGSTGGHPEYRSYFFEYNIDLDDIDWELYPLNTDEHPDINSVYPNYELMEEIPKLDNNINADVNDLNKTLIINTFNEFMKSNYSNILEADDAIDNPEDIEWMISNYDHSELVKINNNKLTFHDYNSYSSY